MISHRPVQLFAFRVTGGRPTRVGRGAFGGLFSRLPLKRAADVETNRPFVYASGAASLFSTEFLLDIFCVILLIRRLGLANGTPANPLLVKINDRALALALAVSISFGLCKTII